MCFHTQMKWTVTATGLPSVSPHSSLLHLCLASWSAVPAACANLYLSQVLTCLLCFPPALPQLISLTSSSFTNQHRYLSSSLWLIQCPIVLCEIIECLFSSLSACGQPWLFLHSFSPILFSQITCLLSVPNHKLLDFLHVADSTCWIYLPR